MIIFDMPPIYSYGYHNSPSNQANVPLNSSPADLNFAQLCSPYFCMSRRIFFFDLVFVDL